MKVLITGVSGFIGGCTAIRMKELGYTVHGLDIARTRFVDSNPLDEFFRENYANFVATDNYDATIHCAGTSLVGPSMKDPDTYYSNNVAGTINFLSKNGNKLGFVVFSSSAAVYGKGDSRFSEDSPLCPISPYGETKKVIEEYLRLRESAYGHKYIAFRYFNAAGAIPNYGQTNDATHIIPMASGFFLGYNPSFRINGTEYDTFDGSTIREYIHVDDIVKAHIMAVEGRMPTGIYNLGGVKSSTIEVASIVRLISGQNKEIPMSRDVRLGDPPVLLSDSRKIREYGFTIEHDLHDIIRSAYEWHKKELHL